MHHLAKWEKITIMLLNIYQEWLTISEKSHHNSNPTCDIWVPQTNSYINLHFQSGVDYVYRYHHALQLASLHPKLHVFQTGYIL